MKSLIFEARAAPQHNFGYLGVPYDAATSIANPGRGSDLPLYVSSSAAVGKARD